MVVMLAAVAVEAVDSVLLPACPLLLELLMQLRLAREETEHLLLILETAIAEPVEQILFLTELPLQAAALVVAGLLVKPLVLLAVRVVAVKKVPVVVLGLLDKGPLGHPVGKVTPTTVVAVAVQLLLELRAQEATLAVLVVRAPQTQSPELLDCLHHVQVAVVAVVPTG